MQSSYKFNRLKRDYGIISESRKRLTATPTGIVQIVASAERSFSKLKLLKSHLRNNMCDERLSHLALILIKDDRLIDVTQADVVERFSAMHARKVDLSATP